MAALAQHLAEHSGGLEPGHAGEVDRGLGMSCPAKHAALLSDQRKEMTRAGKIAGFACGIEDGQDRGGPLLGGNARPR